MATTFRFEVLLTGVRDNRHGELREILLSTHTKSGKNQWNEVFRKVRDGEPQSIYQANSKDVAHRMAAHFYRVGADVELVDNLPELEDEFGGEEKMEESPNSVAARKSK